jgi:hypothetical protein
VIEEKPQRGGEEKKHTTTTSTMGEERGEFNSITCLRVNLTNNFLMASIKISCLVTHSFRSIIIILQKYSTNGRGAKEES